jgi:hypothetical protein
MLSSISDLPIGQRLLKEGFTPVTNQDLKSLLRCKEIEEEEQKRLKQKVYDEFVAKIRIAYCYDKDLCDYAISSIEEMSGGFNVSGFKRTVFRKRIVRRDAGGSYTSFHLPQCTVEYTSLEEYMGSEIPAEILDRILLAKSIGVRVFVVAYPILRWTDPVVIGLLGDAITDTKVLIGQWQ